MNCVRKGSVLEKRTHLLKTSSVWPSADFQIPSRQANRLLVSVMTLSILSLAVTGALGQASPSKQPGEVAAQQPPAEAAAPFRKPPLPEKLDDQERKDAMLWSIWALTAIILVTAVLLVFVVMWGHRTRRLARHIPHAVPRDELWFLKSGKRKAGSEPFHLPEDSDDDELMPPEETRP